MLQIYIQKQKQKIHKIYKNTRNTENYKIIKHTKNTTILIKTKILIIQIIQTTKNTKYKNTKNTKYKNTP